MKRSFLTPAGEIVEFEYNDQAPRQFVAPVSYAEHADATATELETERDALVAELPKLKGGLRSKADHRIRVLDREIRAALDAEEAERRNSEREKERPRQQVGADSPFARQTLSELVASVVAVVAPKKGSTEAGVKASPTPKKKTKAEEGWTAYLKDLDTRLAARALEALRRGETIPSAARPQAETAKNAVCCGGPYKCPACRAKAAA